MQRNGMSDVRILLINNYQLPGLISIGDVGFDESPIEVPELGKIRLIGSGTEKIQVMELMYLVKRDSPVLHYVLDWRDKYKKEARDVVMLYTDKTGDVTNAYRRDSFVDCELGKIMSPSFEEGSRKYAQLVFSLFPWDYQVRTL